MNTRASARKKETEVFKKEKFARSQDVSRSQFTGLASPTETQATSEARAAQKDKPSVLKKTTGQEAQLQPASLRLDEVECEMEKMRRKLVALEEQARETKFLQCKVLAVEEQLQILQVSTIATVEQCSLCTVCNKGDNVALDSEALPGHDESAHVCGAAENCFLRFLSRWFPKRENMLKDD